MRRRAPAEHRPHPPGPLRCCAARPTAQPTHQPAALPFCHVCCCLDPSRPPRHPCPPPYSDWRRRGHSTDRPHCGAARCSARAVFPARRRPPRAFCFCGGHQAAGRLRGHRTTPALHQAATTSNNGRAQGSGAAAPAPRRPLGRRSHRSRPCCASSAASRRSPAKQESRSATTTGYGDDRSGRTWSSRCVESLTAERRCGRRFQPLPRFIFGGMPRDCRARAQTCSCNPAQPSSEGRSIGYLPL